MKPFIITIDTEGDNLWAWKSGDKVLTENTLYLERFQALCNKYNFKPVYLTNYEMISDSRYVEFINKYLKEGKCEIGMHLHAENNPPFYKLKNVKNNNNFPYLIEYPKNIMNEKIAVLTEKIFLETGVRPITHRAGRWATNDDYFQLLSNHGYKIDCSVTPNISWKTCLGQTDHSCGSDYTHCLENTYEIKVNKKHKLYEVPMTVRKCRKFILPERKNLKGILKSFKNALMAEPIWLRPNGKNLNQLLFLSDYIYKSNSDYLMFMLHSSELMPGGSPTFKDSSAIEKLYSHLEILFEHLSEKYYGCTLEQYYEVYIKEERKS